MKRMLFVLLALAIVASVLAATAASRPADEAARAIDAGKRPDEYRDWRLISVAREEGDLDDIRAVLGNDEIGRAHV